MKQTVEIFDETFVQDRTASYILSIQVSLDGFYFALLDSVRNTYIGLYAVELSPDIFNREQFSAFFAELKDKFPWLANSFKRVYFSSVNSGFTLAPRSFITEESARAVFEQVNPLAEGSMLHLHNLEHIDGTVVFDLPEALENAWLELQPETRFIPPIVPLLYLPSQERKRKVINAFTVDNRLFVSLHAGGALMGVNGYTLHDKADIAYYIHAFTRANGISCENTTLYLSGSPDCIGDTSSFSGKFERFNTVASYAKSVMFSYRLLRYRSEYFNLFSQPVLCE